MRALLLALALGGCAMASVSHHETRVMEVPPPPLRECTPPVPPPHVPPAPRTVEALAAYAWAEASARWRTAERLDECKRRMNELNDWVEKERGRADH